MQTSRLDKWEGSALNDLFRCSTHTFGVADAVKLVGVLGLMPARLVIYGIEGRRFGLESAPSVEVVTAAEELAHRLVRAESSDRTRIGMPHAFFLT